MTKPTQTPDLFTAIEALRITAVDAQSPLNEQSAKLLFAVTLQAVRALNSVRRSKAEILRPIGRQTVFWPILASPKPQFVADFENVLADLQIGQESSWSLDASTRYKLDTTAGKWAGHFHAVADFERATARMATINAAADQRKATLTPSQAEAATLPELSRSTADRWFDWGKKYVFPLDLHDRPEWKEQLAGHKEIIGKEAAIRSWVLSQIKQAFVTQLPPD